MARLPRLVLPGRAHLVILRSHGAVPVFVDDVDRCAFLAALREAATPAPVAVHGYALTDSEVLLLVTPQEEAVLSRMVQTLGRRYVSAYNRRHGRRGTLWDGRYRSGVVESGHWLLVALRWVDGQAGVTSAGHRVGSERDPMLVDPAEFWALGNTPFDREAAYRLLLVQGLSPVEAKALRDAALGGWALGSPAFLAEVASETARPLSPRPRGRPRSGA